MGLHDGPWSRLCEERCREAAFRDKMRRSLEADAAGPGSGAEVAPQALRAETAGPAVSTVETGVTRHGIARVFAATGRLFRPGNGIEKGK